MATKVYRSDKKIKVPAKIVALLKADRKRYLSQNQHKDAIGIHFNTYKAVFNDSVRSDVLDKVKEYLDKRKSNK